ncbi:YdeI/OmpD-associated family protein [Methylobacterium oxalidis]|nr:YdeI/OmpD-associated family protein [Methylobacterium oxalidis]
MDILLPSGQARQPPFRSESMNASVASLGGLMASAFSHGTVHEAREDLQAAVRSDPEILLLWESLTSLGRNEFICWVDDAKQATTRQRRIERTCEALLEGKKRPCCWAGCIHRTDKAPSRWQQAVLIDRKAKNGS